ncbi:unnamed protein product [Peronospora farinosa]|uniref:Uncharacterized protein n=1 Tax=Peronospora farinosa TaxID=134698 RepID=A0AAV0U5G7_9STRA|nr:unnamed protein product [Peronospora farinosa]
MVPLYKRSIRNVWKPYRRLRLGAVIGGITALMLLFLLFYRLSPEVPAPSLVTLPQPLDVVRTKPLIDVPTSIESDGDGDMEKETEEAMESTDSIPSSEFTTQVSLVLRFLLPLVAGFCFGFLGSVPIAGPTSAMVLKLGIQGKYTAGLTIAIGGAISEATYAGFAFWGFGSFLAGAKFLLPLSKVLGAIMFTLIGFVFLKADMKPSLDPDLEASVQGPQGEVCKNILMGLTMSGINPALLASYTGAIASVYGTGMLEFTLFLAVVFAVGVCCGVSTWFYLLLSLLKKYKQRLKNHTIDLIMRGLGCFLLALGILCAKSSFDYFLSASPETK